MVEDKRRFAINRLSYYRKDDQRRINNKCDFGNTLLDFVIL